MIENIKASDYFNWHEKLRGIRILKDGIEQSKAALFYEYPSMRNEIASQRAILFTYELKDGFSKDGNYSADDFNKRWEDEKDNARVGRLMAQEQEAFDVVAKDEGNAKYHLA